MIPAPHGGRGLINRFVPAPEIESFLKKASNLKACVLSKGDLSIFYRIADGTLSPLEGPMDKKEFHRVLDEEIIERDGKKFAWTIPVAFPAAKKICESFEIGETVALKDEQDVIVGTLEISDIYPFDKVKFNRVVYGTKRTDHPGPRIINDNPRDYLLGGRIHALPGFKHPEYGKYMLSPEETRVLFLSMREFPTCKGGGESRVPRPAGGMI